MNLKKQLKRLTVGKVIIYLIVLALAIATLFPFWYIVVGSVTSSATYYSHEGVMLWPTELNFEAYAYMFEKGWESPIITGYITTIEMTVIGTLMSMFFTAILAYSLSRRYLPGRNVVMMGVFFTTIFTAGTIPGYLLVNALKLNNTFWVYVIPGCINAFNTIVLRNFFQTIPFELEEAAKIDGASDIRVFVQVILPLAAPGLATIALFYAVAYWNEWFSAVLYIREKSLWPLQMYMREILINSDVSGMAQHTVQETGDPPPTFSIKGATTVATTLPILVLYPFLQKYFVTGMTMGSVKG